MDRTELKRQLDRNRAEAEAYAAKLQEQLDNVRLTDGWILEALATEHLDRLKTLAADYGVEVTDDVVRGVWLASQLVLDLDPDTMLADN